MRLAARITAILLTGVLTLMVIGQFIMYQHENEELEQDMRVDASQLGKTISSVVDELWQLGGQQSAHRAVNEINSLRSQRRVRVVYFDVDPGAADAPARPDVSFAALGDVYTASCRGPDGHEHLYTYSRLTLVGRPAAIEVSEPLDAPQRKTTYFAMHALVLMGATTLLGAVMVVAIGGAWIGRPLRRLIEKTRRIGEGDLSGPLKMKRSDEFGELADAINSMCDQLRVAQDKINAEAKARMAALDQLRHADRLRTVGRLAAGLAHELGTPLNVVSGRAGLIASGRLSEEDTRRSATIIKNEADRIATIIRQLLDFARRNSPQRKSVDLPAVARQTVSLLSPIAEKRNSNIEFTAVPDSLMLRVDASQIQQVLTNLIMNGVESMPHGGTVAISILTVSARPPEGNAGAAGTYARIDIQDHGEGISPEIMEQIFEPFFTTKSVGEGTGLGLSIAYGIVQEHGGWIDVSSQPGAGSCFSIYLPLEIATCKDKS